MNGKVEGGVRDRKVVYVLVQAREDVELLRVTFEPLLRHRTEDNGRVKHCLDGWALFKFRAPILSETQAGRAARRQRLRAVERINSSFGSGKLGELTGLEGAPGLGTLQWDFTAHGWPEACFLTKGN